MKKFIGFPCRMENGKCRMKNGGWRIVGCLSFFILNSTFFIFLAGCSSLTPSAKTQSMSLYAIGIPGIAVVHQSEQKADNSGDDDNQPTQHNPVNVKAAVK